MVGEPRLDLLARHCKMGQTPRKSKGEVAQRKAAWCFAIGLGVPIVFVGLCSRQYYFLFALSTALLGLRVAFFPSWRGPESQTDTGSGKTAPLHRLPGPLDRTLIIIERVCGIRRVSSSPFVTTRLVDAMRGEARRIEEILNQRVHFLLASSAILAAASTSVEKPWEKQFTYGIGACVAFFSIVGIDRACCKLNFLLSWLNSHREASEFDLWNREGRGNEGVPGAVYICTYGLAVFIFCVFLWLASGNWYKS